MKCVKRVSQLTHVAVLEVLLGSYRILLLELFRLKAYGGTTIVISISVSQNNLLDEAQVYHKKNLKHNSRLGLHCNMAELHYRYEQSKAAGRQDREQLGRQEAQRHRGVAYWC